MRLDKYLKVSRLIKRRTVANDACDAARITVNGKPAKASYQVKIGDVIEIAFGQRTMKVEVLNIAEHTLKADASALYKEGSYMAQEERSREMPHSVILEGREKLTISGVTDVHSFDEEQVLLETVRGMLVVRGQGLHVERLQLEAGELIIQGEIGLLEYDDSVQPRDSLFRRIFGG